MSPIAFSIGDFTVYWYSLFILSGFILGYLFAYLEIKRHNIGKDFLADYFFYLVPIVILGARLYYVIFEWHYYSNNLFELLQIWNGGLAIHGGIIAGAIYTIFYTRYKKINTFKFIDIAAPSLALGQALGRWGNFFNQEAYGPLTTIDKLHDMFIPKFVIDGMYIKGAYYEPTFYYESLTCFFIFIVIILLRKYCKKLNVGTLTGIYFLIYGTERFFVEALRQDSLMLGSIKIAQLVSLLMVILGIGFLIISNIKKIPYLNRERNLNE